MKKNQTNKNIIVTVIAFSIQLGISLYTAPVLVKALGTESYGFIGLANDFVNYLTIITTVFNSVAGRFIAVEMARGDIKKAEKYFNSLLVTNVLLGIVFMLVGVVVVFNAERIFDIPVHLIVDVKVTFAITFATFIIGVVTSIFKTAAFVKNRLDVNEVRNILQCLIRLVCVVILLSFSVLHIYYISIASLIAAIAVAIMNINIKKKLMPEVKIRPSEASIYDVKILASAGAWLAITSMSSLLMRGLDLLVANKFLGAYDMGLLSVSRTLPNSFSSAVATLGPIFTPVFIMHWAKNEKADLISSITNSIKKMGLMMIVPVSGFIVFSKDFYSLWQKTYSEEELIIVTVLSTITVFQCYFNSTTATMAQVSVVVNKLKLPVIVSFVCGILNVITVFILLKFTNLGVYAIAIPSTIILCLRYILFNSFYCARIVSNPIKPFLKSCLRTWITIPIQIGIMYVAKSFVVINSWGKLIVAAFICGMIGYILEFFLIERGNAFITLKKFVNH